MDTQLDLLEVVDVEFDHFGYLSDRLEFVLGAVGFEDVCLLGL